MSDKIDYIAKEWSEFSETAIPTIQANNEMLEGLKKEMKQYSNRMNNLENYIGDVGGASMDGSSITPHEIKSFSVDQNDAGGALVDSTISKKIIREVSTRTIFRRLADVEVISSNSLDVIIENGTLGYGWVNETEERPVTNSSKLIKRNIQLHELYAQPKASQRLIDDSEINFENWLVTNISEIFSNAENAAFINGNGKAKPYGILSYDENIIENIKAETEGAIHFADIINLSTSLPGIYMHNATFLMNRKTLSDIQKIQDTSGRFIWQPAMNERAPSTIFGIPIAVCADMPDVIKGSKAVAIADFKSAYKIVDRKDITIMKDPFTDKPFVKFYATKRVGGEVVQPKAIKFLKF